ncbi:sugar phosphate isomerase/epimerase family protein [Ideonella livida]|uniref:Sugar phosphate isomerase/epimerase n=1 Tax=Ideonella livida TaxID=2707176 RepID=A0A7C9PK71_9BURK|nr:sugar phosphate isomerase/epimerase [Ideonella livida]NDY93749.1 sugar phosphate isomerase/epimerase [Ideonella livida]
MKLAICTDVYGHLAYPDMLDKVLSLGVTAVEMTAGGWAGCPHVKRQELLDSEAARIAFMAELEKRGMEIAALNCSGNPLCPGEMGEQHTASTYDTIRLAGLLGVKKVVMMSGCPAGAPGDTVPNWITSTVSWPAYMAPALDYQWNEVAIPWWRKFVQHCKAHGVTQIAIEEFPCMLVYNPSTLKRLRDATDPIVGINLDPSHLMVMGAEPIAAARALGPAIHHIHGKDARVERGLADVDGLLETRPVTDAAQRTWNYVAVGCGRDLQWWKEFFSVCRMMGYDGHVSLEMEDLTMSVESGVLTSIAALQQTISR